MRRLVRQNMPMEKALELLDQRHPIALKAVLDEMEVRPVMVDRAPTWHKFNFMAFRPVMVPGHVIRTSPLINKSFTLDHDGDQMNFHVIADDKAASEAWEKMRPSRNLVSLTNLRTPRYTPEQEFALGLYKMTREPTKREPATFNTVAEARRAYKQGEIKLNDPIIILDRKPAA
jgi:DNA-directed RNA polymerase subunit beta'